MKTKFNVLKLKVLSVAEKSNVFGGKGIIDGRDSNAKGIIDGRDSNAKGIIDGRDSNPKGRYSRMS